MTVSAPTIANAGEIARERVVLRVLEEIDINKFAVFCCKSDPSGTIYGGNIPAVYWFGRSKKIKKGDLVVVYTKKGKRSEKALVGGATTHFYYWGLSSPIWTPDRLAVLVVTPSWKLSEIQPVDE